MTRSLLLPLVCIQACISAPVPEPRPLGSGPMAVRQSLKVAVLFDGSDSLQVTDPDGTRATALLELLQSLPQDGSAGVQVGVFTAGAVHWQLPAGFQPLTALSAAARQALAQSVLTFVTPANEPNGNATSFLSPLDAAYDLISTDLDCAVTYSVILVTDGHPTNDEDGQLLCGAAVTRFLTLGQQAAGVQVNTAFVFAPVTPLPSSGCGYDAGSGCAVAMPSFCPEAIVASDAIRLQRIATLGGGQFAQFTGSTPVSFSTLVTSGSTGAGHACGP